MLSLNWGSWATTTITMNISIILPLIGLLLHGCQIFVAPRLRLFGYYDKKLRTLNNDKCRPIPEFEGCEGKIRMVIIVKLTWLN